MFSKKQPLDKLLDSDQAVIIEGEFESGDEFGSKDERKSLQQLETALTKSLEEINGDFDGHDIGESTFMIYLYGKNADTLYSQVEHLLRKSDFNHLQITKRYGAADNPNSNERKFSL